MLPWLHGEDFIHGGGLLALGPAYLLNDDHELVSLASAEKSSGAASLIQTHNQVSTLNGPASTVVGTVGSLQIDLIWDSSVRTSANWSAVESAVVQAARIYTGAFSNRAMLNIEVGLGEVGGTALGAGALGESESSGYLMSYAAAAGALANADAGLVQSGQMSATALQSLSGLRGESFFVSSAEAKAIGLTNASAPGIDGYIGLSASPSMFFPAAGGSIKPTQYDAVGVAAHEISEVMGRIGLEGATLGTHPDVYTLLDLFRYSAPHTPQTTSAAGYFSMNNGVSSLELFNNAANGGDAADWATAPANTGNAFDAFDTPGVTAQVTVADQLAVAVLGWRPAPGHILAPVTA
jgi:hypothetical protein